MTAVDRSVPHRSALAIGWARGRTENREFLRTAAAVGFTLAFPVMLLLLFGSMFDEQVEGTDVSYSQVYVAGIIGSSLMSVGFVSLAIGIATEREAGALKRLAGTPMPKVSYFIGKIIHVVTISALEVVILFALGMVLFDLELPADGGRWLTFAWVFGLGATAAAVLGVAVGGVLPSAKAAPAILNVPFVALQFMSGVFVPADSLPSWMYRLSGWFPLRWIAQGMRSVFLPDEFLRVEPDGAWRHPMVAVVLLAWCLGGSAVALRTFRWVGRER
jgi:ABC-2 type transport system permease protein